MPKLFDGQHHLITSAVGTVTSVGLTAPAVFSVSGSPVTSSGTLAFSLANQTANTFFGGPTSGGAASAAFRALVAGDLPAASGAAAGSMSAAHYNKVEALGTVLSVYASGTQATLGTTSAQVDFGTTDPILTITSAGTWLIFAQVRFNCDAIDTDTVSISFKLRRTNNTAADLSGANHSITDSFAPVDGFSYTNYYVTIPIVSYVTANANDTIALFGNRNSVTAGEVRVSKASIVALKISA